MDPQATVYSAEPLLTADPAALRSDCIEAASANIRNALVPLQTIANILHRPYDEESRDWCVRMLELEIRRIVEILDAL
jgi:hypothetical protein